MYYSFLTCIISFLVGFQCKGTRLLDDTASFWAFLFNSVVISSVQQDTVSVHRPGFYAERFQRFMCNTVFKKIPCKWLLPDDPPVAPLPQEMVGRTPLSGSCQGQRPLLLCLHPVSAASRLCVSHCLSQSFPSCCSPLALPTCIAEVRAISGDCGTGKKSVALTVDFVTQAQVSKNRLLCRKEQAMMLAMFLTFHVQGSGIIWLVQVIEALLMTVEGVFSLSPPLS